MSHDERGAALPIHHEGDAFVIDRDGQRLGELTYTRLDPGTIRIDHTGVRDALKGQGAGKRLVEAAVAWARAEQQRIVPRCAFARDLFDKDASLRDVLAP
jgi:predicted GNAT family acetyltransferase